MKKKIMRITTVPASLGILLKGQLKYMNNHYEILGVSSSGTHLKDVEQNEGINTQVVEMTRTISPFKDLKSLYKLYKLIKKEKPFLVHTHTPKAGTLGMIAARLARVPNRLHTIAGLPLLEAKGAKRTLLNIVEKITYANATLILPNSFGLFEIVKENKFTKDNKLKVIGKGSSNGIDTEHFKKSNISKNQQNELKRSLNISDTDFVFTFVGRLVTDKGINELIDAFSLINETNQNIKLLLVGTLETELDPLKDITLSSIESNKNIISVGWQTDVRPYFSISNALVFPSYREGFPNVVMQACAMEIASIVTDINGCNEIITNDKNGIIIQPKSTEDIINAMEFLLNNPEKTKAYANAARSNILKNYNRELIWSELLKLYKSLEA
ncbi:glycosyltransferase family 4 protein [Winogradskyella sp.]|uniref:glycosyltransferase family 4 protein n=1 Tax=Winogradskyella sp. TaxID=1883156 RepID=UPI003F6C2852